MILIYYFKAVIQSPFSNGGSPTPDGLSTGETKFAYMPATAEAIVAGQTGDAQLGQVTTAGGKNVTKKSDHLIITCKSNK